jgi:hypothetical protein
LHDCRWFQYGWWCSLHEFNWALIHEMMWGYGLTLIHVKLRLTRCFATRHELSQDFDKVIYIDNHREGVKLITSHLDNYYVFNDLDYLGGKICVFTFFRKNLDHSLSSLWIHLLSNTLNFGFKSFNISLLDDVDVKSKLVVIWQS